MQNLFNMKRILIKISLVFVVGLTSCGGYNSIVKSTDNNLKYDKALEYYESGDYVKASSLLEAVIPSLRGTEKGEEGLYKLAMAHFENEDYEMAKSYFTAYSRGYPKGKYIEDAHYYIGYSFYKNSPDVKLDQTNTKKAIESFLSFSEKFPQSKRLPEVAKYLTELQEKLAEKEYNSALLYYKLGDYMGNNYLSAVVTATNALKLYPESKFKEELYFLVLKSKFMQAEKSVESKIKDRYRDTVDEYYNFINEFPNSQYKKEADRMFKKAQKSIE